LKGKARIDNIFNKMPYGIQRPHIIITVGTKEIRIMVVEIFISFTRQI